MTVIEGIKLEEFNDCPGSDYVAQKMADLGLDVDAVEIKDYENDQAYRNDSATLVIKLIGRANYVPGYLLRVGKLAVETQADEFDWIYKDDDSYVRLWWD